LQGLLRSAILARSTGASICVGPADAREGAPLRYRPKLSRRSGQHAVLENLALIEAVVGPCSQIRFDLSASIGSRSRADQLLGEGPIGSTAPFALIAPKSSRPIKDWPLERFTEVVRDLWHRHRLASLLVGGPREAQACQTILRRVGTPAQLCLGRPLNVLVALIKRSELVIGLDSGPVHLAAALNKRVVAILGPTDPARFAPFGFESLVAENRSDCLACRSKRSRLVPPRRHTCLVDLPAGAVLNRVQDALGRRAA
jgi:ADP-heptose:LPS heptosyltransferase